MNDDENERRRGEWPLRASRAAARLTTLWATSLSVILASASSAASSVASPTRPNLLRGCGGVPAWIEGAALSHSARDPLSACFQMGSNQAEALLNVANDRDYTELITLAGIAIDLRASSFSDSTDVVLTRLLESRGAGTQMLLLGPYSQATLAMDRPAPEEPAQQVHIAAALGAPSALSGRAFTFLSAAKKRLAVPLRLERCLVSRLLGGIASARDGALALDQMRQCVDRASSPATRAGRLLRGLAAGLLSERLLRSASAREQREPHAPGVAFTIGSSTPGPYNPAIHLDVANLGSISDGRETTRHLSASGGVPPYRYYIISEPGGAKTPSWVHLVPDGTLTLAPPAGLDVKVNLSVQVVDGNGERSEVFP